MKYRPEIDGLRAIAILPLILFHLGYKWISGGYLGVDVFFVISGYLITKLLVTDLYDGNFRMFYFWTRRVKRLLPTMLTVVLFFLIICPFILFKPNIRAFSSDIIPAIFSYFNMYALSHFGDYWGTTAEKSYFLHTWSLSVEEQFYLIYPPILFLIFKYFKKFIIPLLIITVLSLTFYTYFITTNKDYAFYLLPSRIWELSIGGIVSLLSDKVLIKNNRLKNFILFIGIFLILVSYLIPTFVNSNNAICTFLSVAGAGIILGLCNQKDYLGKILSTKPLVYFGRISYSLYLWHWPIIVLFGVFSIQLSKYNNHYINIFIFIVTVLLSVLSFHFIENKTRNAKYTLKLVLALMTSTISLSLYYKSNNFNIFYDSQYNQVKYHSRYYDISPTQPNLENYKALIHNVFIPERKEIYKNAFKEEGITTIVDGRPPKLMLLGDSYGVMWANLVNEICDSLKISRSFYTSNGVKPYFNIKNIDNQKGNKFYSRKERIDYARSVVKNIEKWKPEILIIACKWSNSGDKEELLNLLNYLTSKSIKIVIFNQPPKLEFIGDNNASQYFTYLGINPVKGFHYINTPNNEMTKLENDHIKHLKKKYNNLDIYDVYSTMTKGKKMIVSNNKELFYFDDDHLSYEGTKFHKNNILKLLTSILSE